MEDPNSLRNAFDNHCYFGPKFLHLLQDENIKTILVAGCGGGFDFVHSGLLYPTLRKMGKRVFFLSYSFGVTNKLSQHAPVFFEAKNGACCKKVTTKTVASSHYRPEVGYLQFLEKVFPEDKKDFFMYACYARDWVIQDLHQLYQKICEEHSIDAMVMFDGGSDSLMRGDEQGLGDPLEDAVSVGAASMLNLKTKILISVGLGADRFNGVSDFSSLRAIAELTKEGGFLGSMAIEKDSIGFKFYTECVKTIYGQQKFQSVLTSVVVSAGKGNFGFIIPEDCGGRIRREGSVLVWPLMATLFG